MKSPGPGASPDFGTLTSNVSATFQAKAAGWKRRGQVAAVVLVALAIVGVCLASGLGALTFWVAVVCFAVATNMIGKAGYSKKAFESEVRATEARLRNIEERWRREASEEPFTGKLQDLQKLSEEHRQLPNRRQEKIRNLERNLYNAQLQRYLEKFSIASAEIPHVKDSRKAMLSSFGIDDAADVTAAAVEAVPGFGQFLTEQMVNWRRSLESKFKFDPKRGLDPADVHRVDQEIAKRRSEIELMLSRGPIELTEIRRRIIIARGQLQDQLQRAWIEVAQARANASAA